MPALTHPEHIIRHIPIRGDVRALETSGNIYIATAFARAFPSGHVYTIAPDADTTRYMTRTARASGRAELTALHYPSLMEYLDAFAPRTMHAVMLPITLSRIADPEMIFTRAASLIAPTGALLVIEWEPSRELIGPARKSRIPASVIRAWGEHIGLRERRTVPLGAHQYGIVFYQPLPAQ